MGNSEFEGSYRAGQLIAGRAAWQGVWFGWFGLVKVPPSTNATQLLRAIPNWDNMLNVPLGSRTWNEGTDTYTSSNSFIDNKIAYSWNWRKRNKLFVVRHSTTGGAPTITVPAGKTLSSIMNTDQFGLETTSCSNCFTQTNATTITPGTITNDKLYVLHFSGNPTFQNAVVSVADQLNVFWNAGDSLAMKPDTGSVVWTAKVNGVGKSPQTTNRIGNNHFRLVFPTNTIITGDQTVTVTYTPGNITNGSLAPVIAFTDQPVTNNLPGGGPVPVQTQTRSQFRHFEGDEIITANMKYGNENGGMNVILGGVFRDRLKVANTVAAANNVSFPLFYDRNDSTFLRVTNSCATSAVIFIDAPQFPTGTLTTEQLQSSHTTNVVGQIVESAGSEPTVTLPQDSESEMEYALKICTDAALGAMRFRVHDSAGEALDAYNITPTATVVAGHSERHGGNITGGNW